MDSLLSIVQMPAGIPVGTLAIGRAGAVNAALLAAAILGHPAIRRPGIAARLDALPARGADRCRGPDDAARLQAHRRSRRGRPGHPAWHGWPGQARP